ncbi:MAG TPA: hypothetical protein VJA25_04805 [Dehalococcoidia bacterium]|nr:hypothetical protein [Dehalococcoidia bacterium]
MDKVLAFVLGVLLGTWFFQSTVGFLIWLVESCRNFCPKGDD